MPNSKKDWRKGKGAKLVAFFFLSKLREYDEIDLQKRFKSGEFTYDEVLIKESSKPIFQNHKNHITKATKKKSGNLMFYSHSSKEERNVNLIFLTLLKFKGLIRYMNFQDLVNNDIRKISCYITHKFCSKGQYLFRQFDSSDSMYGVINGKVDIRLVSDFDYTKIFYNALSKGEDEEEDNHNTQEIPVENFMSDLEEDFEDSDSSIHDKSYSEDSDDSNDESVILKNNIIQKIEGMENINNFRKSSKNLTLNLFSRNNKIDNIDNIDNKDNDKNENEMKNVNDNNITNNENVKNDNVNNNNINNNDNNNNNNMFLKLKKNNKMITEDFIDKMTDIKIRIRLKKKLNTQTFKISSKQLNTALIQTPKQKNIETIKSKKSKKEKKRTIIKAIQNHQTPDKLETLEEIENFILNFEIPRAQLSEGMCFGEWGILYSIPRTTSIYCLTDVHLFCLKKKFFDKYLAQKFLITDMKKIKFILSIIPSLKKDYKMGKMLTKIVPIFCERGELIYSPFDKANIVYILYKGECALYRILGEISCKDDILLNQEKLQMLFRFNPGGVCGLESCMKDKYYEYCLIVTKPMTIIYKVEMNFMLKIYKDFREDIKPMYEEQNILIDNLIRNSEETSKFCKLKNVIHREKEKLFYDDFHKDKLRPISTYLRSFNNKINVKNINPKVSYEKSNKKKYNKYNSLVPNSHHPSFSKVTVPSYFAKQANENKKDFITDIIYISNKKTSHFNIRPCKTRINKNVKTRLFIKDVIQENYSIDGKKTKRTDTESDSLYSKRLKIARKLMGLNKYNKLTKSADKSFEEITNSINSNYSCRSGIKYFKSGKYDLPFVG